MLSKIIYAVLMAAIIGYFSFKKNERNREKFSRDFKRQAESFRKFKEKEEWKQQMEDREKIIRQNSKRTIIGSFGKEGVLRNFVNAAVENNLENLWACLSPDSRKLLEQAAAEEKNLL